MGSETLDWYNRNCLTGFTDQRGYAWHRDADLIARNKWEDNAYPGAIPVDDVIRRLFHWQALSGPVSTEFYDEWKDCMRTVTDPTRQAIIRPDTQTIFGIFKDSYQIHQHDEWLIDNAAAILDSNVSDVGIANAILLKGGAVAAVQFELPENITLSAGISVRPSLLAVGSMDGSLRTGYRATIVNVVCDNTMSAALSQAMQAYLLKHSKYSHLKTVEAQEALGMLFEIGATFKTETDNLLGIKVNGKQFKQYLDFTVPLPDNRIDAKTGKPMSNKAITLAESKRETLLTMWMSDERVAPWMGTAYGVWQLNNTYNHHFVGTNGDTVRGERNMMNAASGAFHKSDVEAMDVLFDKVLQIDMATA